VQPLGRSRPARRRHRGRPRVVAGGSARGAWRGDLRRHGPPNRAERDRDSPRAARRLFARANRREHRPGRRDGVPHSTGASGGRRRRRLWRGELRRVGRLGSRQRPGDCLGSAARATPPRAARGAGQGGHSGPDAADPGPDPAVRHFHRVRGRAPRSGREPGGGPGRRALRRGGAGPAMVQRGSRP
jgi:hypothetical protein